MDNIKGPLTHMLYTDLMLKMSDHLRMPPDRTSRAHSQEACRVAVNDRSVAFAAAVLGNLKSKSNTLKSLPQRTVGGDLSRPLMVRKNQGFSFPLGRGMPGGLRLSVRQPTNPSRLVDEAGFERHVLESIVDTHIHGTSGHFDRLWMLTNLKVCLGILTQASHRHRKIFSGPSMPPLEKRRCQRQATEVDPSARTLKKLCILCMENRSIRPPTVKYKRVD